MSVNTTITVVTPWLPNYICFDVEGTCKHLIDGFKKLKPTEKVIVTFDDIHEFLYVIRYGDDLKLIVNPPDKPDSILYKCYVGALLGTLYADGYISSPPNSIDKGWKTDILWKPTHYPEVFMTIPLDIWLS